MAPDNIPYDIEWLRLLDTVERIKAANGIDEDPAKIGLCLAISDHKIKFRGHVGKVESLREYAYADSSLIVGTVREKL